MQTTLEAKKRQLEQLERKAVPQRDIEKLRAELQQLIHDVGCEMREVYIEDMPTRRPWKSNDSPLLGPPTGNPGQETPFFLTQRNAKIRIEGPMPSIYTFLARLNQMDRFIHTKMVSLQRSDADENQTQLRIEMTLFDLERKSASPGGA
jgi:hypothetical protein